MSVVFFCWKDAQAYHWKLFLEKNWQLFSRLFAPFLSLSLLNFTSFLFFLFNLRSKQKVFVIYTKSFCNLHKKGLVFLSGNPFFKTVTIGLHFFCGKENSRKKTFFCFFFGVRHLKFSETVLSYNTFLQILFWERILTSSTAFSLVTLEKLFFFWVCQI